MIDDYSLRIDNHGVKVSIPLPVGMLFEVRLFLPRHIFFLILYSHLVFFAPPGLPYCSPPRTPSPEPGPSRASISNAILSPHTKNLISGSRQPVLRLSKIPALPASGTAGPDLLAGILSSQKQLMARSDEITIGKQIDRATEICLVDREWCVIVRFIETLSVFMSGFCLD